MKGLGFRVWGLGFKFQGFRVQGVRVQGLRFRGSLLQESSKFADTRGIKSQANLILFPHT